jgi:hypothetical protein
MARAYNAIDSACEQLLRVARDATCRAGSLKYFRMPGSTCLPPTRTGPRTAPPKRLTASSKPHAESPVASGTFPITESDAYSPPAAIGPTGSNRETMPKCEGPLFLLEDRLVDLFSRGCRCQLPRLDMMTDLLESRPARGYLAHHRRLRLLLGLHPFAQPRSPDAGGDPAVGHEGSLSAGVDPILKRGEVRQ